MLDRRNGLVHPFSMCGWKTQNSTNLTDDIERGPDVGRVLRRATPEVARHSGETPRALALPYQNPM
ncbi:hypothetical protein F444_22357 [Phytophthora nicotianae P1976]|uniref:Uncharacterized protein n=1 Tax=Phytophthora nicotianae P1976 TaxID=1317066 RepID=A0A080YY11_PHYNI|nr:hypothetical protein F444_22357 [Phytophthora nicotianae P1976]